MNIKYTQNTDDDGNVTSLWAHHLSACVPVNLLNNDYMQLLHTVCLSGDMCVAGQIDPIITQHVQQFKTQSQIIKYKQAKSRLEQHVLSEGREATYTQETFYTQLSGEPVEQTRQVIMTQAIDPVELTIEHVEPGDPVTGTPSTTTQIENPLIIQDELERAAAQQVVDDTPDEIKQLVDSE
jgi:hypothetical protein